MSTFYQQPTMHKPAMVVQMPGKNGMAIVHDRPRWSWCSMIWAILSTFCCNSLCGFIGILYALMSYTDHKAADFERSRHKRRWSWCCSITGIVLGLIFLAIFLVVFFVYRDAIMEMMCERNPSSCRCNKSCSYF